MLKQLIRITDYEMIRYLIVGTMTTLVSTGTFLFLCELLGWGVTLSNVLSIITAIAFAYVTNKKYVFRSRSGSRAEMAAECARFIGTRLFSMGVEVGGVFLLYNIVGTHEVTAKILTQIVVIVLNYAFGMRSRVGREEAGEKAGFSSQAVLIGTMVYTFSGCDVYSGVRHPYFLMPLIWLPLICRGVEPGGRAEDPLSA